MIRNVDEFASEMVDREAIRDCIYLYARAIDRCDEELLRDAYWPDATANQLEFSGGRDDFVTWSITSLKGADCAAHHIGNILIRLSGAAAAVETYFNAYQAYSAGEEKRAANAGGRYLDRFERRDGAWRIAHRTVVIDYFSEFEDSSDWSVGPFGMKAERGGKRPNDKSYALFEAEQGRAE